MEEFKKISDEKISEIAAKHKIDVSIINEISDELAYYIDYLHDSFKEFKELALKIGFEHVESGPLVRSSYHAEEAFK